MERLITVGLFVIETGRFPRRNERLPFMVQASEPKRGSVEVVTWLRENAVLLPLFHELYLTGAADLIWNWVSGAMLKLGGRPRDADRHFDKLLDVVNAMDERRHLETMAWTKLANSTRQIVSPVGRSCESLILTNPEKEQTEIDTPMADAIRSSGKLEVSDMTTIRVTVDGFTHHNRQLKVVHPDEPTRFVTASVRDPAFDSAPNIYTEAATGRRMLEVSAKVTLKDGRIQRMYIMDAVRVERVR